MATRTFAANSQTRLSLSCRRRHCASTRFCLFTIEMSSARAAESDCRPPHKLRPLSPNAARLPCGTYWTVLDEAVIKNSGSGKS
jgi:hypothetical protein